MKPTTLLIAGITAFTLAACSSGPRQSVSRAALPANLAFATGPIYSACRAGGRDQASRARCGCVQAVANRELSANDQRRGAAFFKNPHQAQVTRQSDRPADERFWLRWKAYSQDAARMCS